MTGFIRKSDIQAPATEPGIPTGKFMMVQCEGFRCLAYLDRQNVWRAAYTDQPLHGRVTVQAW